MPYQYAYKDRYVRRDEGKIESDTTGSVAFASIPDDIPTRLVVEWTGKQFTKLFSAVFQGAFLTFPDEAEEIIWQLLKVVHQPIPLDPDGDCIEYLPSVPFVKFYPDNPYIDGDNKDGWWREAWFQWEDFFSLFPEFAADWLGGVVGGFVGYQNTDILCNIASLAYPTWSAFFDAGGVFPKIEIKFTGSGQVNLSMLSFPLGGKAIVSLDSEPDILDILTGGILDPAAFMVELDRDIISFPPQEYPLIVLPVQVETTGAHTIYINFIPVIDDTTTFLRFGGGFRGLEMCGFAEVGEVGIEQVIWDGCALKVVQGGITTEVVTAAEIQACMDIPEGGGNGGGAISVKGQVFDIVGNVDNNTTTFQTALSLSYTPARSNFLVLVKNLLVTNTGDGSDVGEIRLRFNSAAGVKNPLIEFEGDALKSVAIDDWWQDVEVGVARTLAVEMRSQTSTNAARLNPALDQQITIIEWDNAEDLFIQDVRYLDGVLQKQLGGAWFDVVDIEALLAPIQSLAASANTAASNALTVANNAASVNAAQQTTLNNHEARLDTLEGTVNDLVTIDIAQINLTIADHETRIDALEAAGGSSGDWAGEKLGRVQDLFSALNPSGGRYSIIDGSYQTSPVAGIQADSAQNIVLLVNDANRYSSVAFVGITIFMLASPDSIKMSARINDNAHQQRLDFVSIGVNNYFRAYLPIVGRDDGVPPHPQSSMLISLGSYDTSLDETDWRLIGLTYLCFAINPFTGTLFP